MAIDQQRSDRQAPPGTTPGDIHSSGDRLGAETHTGSEVDVDSERSGVDADARPSTNVPVDPNAPIDDR